MLDKNTVKESHTLLKHLTDNRVEFVIIGGYAAVVYGSSMVTEDLDLCVPFSRENMHNLLNALSDAHPSHRMIGDNLPLSESAKQLSSFRNLYLTTDFGYLDLLGSVAGIGSYEDVIKESEPIELFDFSCQVLKIDALIRAKEEMKRPKDLETVKQLKVIKSQK